MPEESGTSSITDSHEQLEQPVLVQLDSSVAWASPYLPCVANGVSRLANGQAVWLHVNRNNTPAGASPDHASQTLTASLTSFARTSSQQDIKGEMSGPIGTAIKAIIHAQCKRVPNPHNDHPECRFGGIQST